MAKRYYKSGLEAHERREEKILKGIKTAIGGEFYAGRGERDVQESRDGGMISEDRTAMANLPQNVIMREYPKYDGARFPHLDDTIKGIDVQREDDKKQNKTEQYPWKY